MDTVVGHWLLAPYVWTEGPTWRECSRHYLVPDATPVYNEQGRESTFGSIKMSQDPWYLRTMEGSDTETVKRYFQVYTQDTCLSELNLRYVAVPISALLTHSALSLTAMTSMDMLYELLDIDSDPNVIQTLIHPLPEERQCVIKYFKKLKPIDITQSANQLLSDVAKIDVMHDEILMYLEEGAIAKEELTTLNEAKAGHREVIIDAYIEELKRQRHQVEKQIDQLENSEAFKEYHKLEKMHHKAPTKKLKSDPDKLTKAEVRAKMNTVWTTHSETFEQLDTKLLALDELDDKIKKGTTPPLDYIHQQLVANLGKIMKILYEFIHVGLREEDPEDDVEEDLKDFVVKDDDDLNYEDEQAQKDEERAMRRHSGRRIEEEPSSADEDVSMSVEESSEYSDLYDSEDSE